MAEERDQKIRTTTVREDVRRALADAKVIDEAREDALFIAENIFDVREADGVVAAKQGAAVPEGTTPKEWIANLQSANTKPHWFGVTVGGGANPGRASPGGGTGNPWSKEDWNMTQQGAVIREKGAEAADRMAKSAGHKAAIGALRRNAK